MTEDLLARISIASDASHYRLTPRSTGAPVGVRAVQRLLEEAVATAVPITFRSGGTSLSGQAVTDGHLADTRRHFRGIEVLDGGRRVRAQPGATVRAVNGALRPYGRRIGPDPASEGACTVGGVVANNSSGMTCGVTRNAYATLDSATLVLPSGTMVDTADPSANVRLRQSEPGIYTALLRLRDRVRGDAAMVDAVQRLFAMKNTMGYSVNAFLDADDPVGMLLRLVVGSEGTLAFVASATFRTIPVRPQARTALLGYPDLELATAEIGALVEAGAEAVELLDSRSLAVAALGTGSGGALLVEFQGESADEVEAAAAAVAPALRGRALGTQGFTADSAARAALWASRKGLYAAVAGARRAGTTALLEDVAVPVAALPQLCRDLSQIFDAHGYDDSVIFGHAKDGNVHFMITEDFSGAGGIERYAAFTESMVDCVLGLGGTLKAEHGTGRVMAPFVRRQYGDDLYAIMVEIKDALDPRGILNPGVIINSDPRAHLENLKAPTPVDAVVDSCVECGFCEPVCPSRDLTLTPRQRIVALRAIGRAEAQGDRSTADVLAKQFRYAGVDTCAADGMCQTVCPVGIDTGVIVRSMRTERTGRLADAFGEGVARCWAIATRTAAATLSTARRSPRLAELLTGRARRHLSDEVVPQWSAELPGGGDPRSGLQGQNTAHDAVAIYFPSCTGAVFGGSPGVAQAFLSLCAKAGVTVRVPEPIDGLCCGMPWSSKGMARGARRMADRVSRALREGTDGGRLTVLMDASSCTEGLRKLVAGDGIEVEDIVSFTTHVLLPRLEVLHGEARMVVHPTCSAVRMGIDGDLLELAGAISPDVFVPPDWGCCGFAGDRGLLHPELTESATRRQAEQVRASNGTAWVSCNRTCEIGMTRAVGLKYRHVIEVLDEVTVPSPADVTANGEMQE